MVMDNCVLQMNMFENFHPGGVFTMQKNYGRDVTKYFNGAYKLV
jgi:cytochrome b involved in lipid metabolism